MIIEGFHRFACWLQQKTTGLLVEKRKRAYKELTVNRIYALYGSRISVDTAERMLAHLQKREVIAILKLDGHPWAAERIRKGRWP